MQQLIDEVTSRTLRSNLDLGECCGLAVSGTAYNDYKDAIECEFDAELVVIAGEYQGLALCAKHYRKLQKQGEL